MSSSLEAILRAAVEGTAVDTNMLKTPDTTAVDNRTSLRRSSPRGSVVPDIVTDLRSSCRDSTTAFVDWPRARSGSVNAGCRIMTTGHTTRNATVRHASTNYNPVVEQLIVSERETCVTFPCVEIYKQNSLWDSIRAHSERRITVQCSTMHCSDV